MTQRDENERVRTIYEKTAPKYDRQIRFFERILFAGSREWVCSRARGDTLEIAVGTGRNLEFYPGGVKLTGIEYSPAMLDIARSRGMPGNAAEAMKMFRRSRSREMRQPRTAWTSTGYRSIPATSPLWELRWWAAVT